MFIIDENIMKKIHFLEKENIKLTKLIKHHQEESFFLNNSLLDFLEINKDLNHDKNNVSLSSKDELVILNNDFNALKKDYDTLSKKNSQLTEYLNEMKKDYDTLSKKNSQLTEYLNEMKKDYAILSKKNSQLINNNLMNQIKIKNLEAKLIKNKINKSNNILQKLFFKK